MSAPLTPEQDDNAARLSIFDPARCRCQFGHCAKRATVDGLCDACWLEYAAARNAYLGPDEWH